MNRTILVCALGVFILVSGCQTQSPTTKHSEHVVIWGDPQSTAQNPLVRDVNNLEDRGILVDDDNRVVFVDGSICTDCEVVDSTIFIDGVARVDIRFGPDRDGADARRPYLVTHEDGFMIEVQDSDDGMMFEAVNEVFEEDDDSSDDLADRDGLYDNPFYTQQ